MAEGTDSSKPAVRTQPSQQANGAREAMRFTSIRPNTMSKTRETPACTRVLCRRKLVCRYASPRRGFHAIWKRWHQFVLATPLTVVALQRQRGTRPKTRLRCRPQACIAALAGAAAHANDDQTKEKVQTKEARKQWWRRRPREANPANHLGRDATAARGRAIAGIEQRTLRVAARRRRMVRVSRRNKSTGGHAFGRR